MIYRHLGSAGLKVSTLSFGAWVTFGEQVSRGVAYDCMVAAYEAGVNFFDNAEAYADGEAEEVMAGVIKKAGWKRSDLVLSTKIFWGGAGPNDRGLSRKHIIEGTDAALRRLRTDYVDLVYCHRPDVETPIEETVRAMDHLVTSGRAFYWGTSEWSAEEIRSAYEFARREHLTPPTMEQPQYNMLIRERVEREYARLYPDIGLGLTTFSPLHNGVLTGKYNEGIPSGTRLDLEDYEWLRKRVGIGGESGRKKIETVRKLQPIANELGCSLAQLSIAWCLKNPNVSSVIMGASRASQVVENLKALDVYTSLDRNVMSAIEEVLDNRPSRVPNFRG